MTKCAPRMSTGRTITVLSKKIAARSLIPSGKLDRKTITPNSDINTSWQTDRPARTKLVASLSIPAATIAGMYWSRKPDNNAGDAATA